MAYTVELSKPATTDLARIGGYIARDSPSNANKVVTEIFEAIERLARFPYAGRPVPEFRQRGWREVFVHEYRVIYGISGNTIQVKRIFHGKRRLKAKHGAGLR